MARFPAARLLLALVVMAVTNAQVDQSQYSVPCVMQYVGCVGIRNFNDAFSRLLGDDLMEPVKCQKFCSGIGATYGSLYDDVAVPELSQSVQSGFYHYHVRNQQYQYDDIFFFLVDILVHLDHVLVNFDDNLSDNHRHITNNVFTHFNILILLDDLSNNVNLNKLINLINKKLPSQHPRPRPARTSTVYRLRPPRQRHGQRRRPPLQPHRSEPTRTGRELLQHYEFEFVFDYLLYFDRICFIVQLGQYSLEHIKPIEKPGSFEHLSRNIINNKLKHTSDFGLFSFHNSSGEHFQQRIHPCNSTPFLDGSCFGSRFNTFCNALRQLDSKQQHSSRAHFTCLDNKHYSNHGSPPNRHKVLEPYSRIYQQPSGIGPGFPSHSHHTRSSCTNPNP
ncbi:hypothetical protein BDP81DRAFT_498215 [Colletotrichum phormii]|uniref:Uncharacterized protein n=1 Tax=Colletotrichum phormii TaxID=359342 RepID=A0AAJ0EJ85_9PEZI|nr:uncharacterized protein BDP81DRAFT_498215 [Colletotrichum phormii]KAK1655020.1 hypothetical protein BDP81DRAFT_498215 [Colletotrichum phormii]